MNKVVLLGRLTREPETRYTQTSNIQVTSFTLAVNRRFTKEGEQQADFINVTAWSKTAEFVSKYFQKGQQVGVIGRLEQHEWEDKEGKKQSRLQVTAEEVYFADSKKEKAEENSKEIAQEDYAINSDEDLPF